MVESLATSRWTRSGRHAPAGTNEKSVTEHVEGCRNATPIMLEDGLSATFIRSHNPQLQALE